MYLVLWAGMEFKINFTAKTSLISRSSILTRIIHTHCHCAPYKRPEVLRGVAISTTPVIARSFLLCHCEERNDEAISLRFLVESIPHLFGENRDCFAPE